MTKTLFVGVGLSIVIVVTGVLYLDLFVRYGYTRDGLVETQNEAQELAALLGPRLSPDVLESFAKSQKIPFKRLEMFLHRNIPTGTSAYKCGKLTFFFDANNKLVDVRGHLLDRSLLHSE
jgi:hypothetical protein